MSPEAPPAGPEAPTWVVRPLRAAAAGGSSAFVGLVVAGQAIALVLRLVVGVYGVWSWVKIGLLTSLLALRTEVEATVVGIPGVARPSLVEPVRTDHWRLVPGLLTIGFVWAIAAGAGRRAARTSPGRSPLAVSLLAAGGAGLPVGVLAALAATVVRLSFPGLGVRLHAEPGSAALWGFALGGAAAGVGAFFEAARPATAATAIRAGSLAYLWGIGLAVVGVLVLAALEPEVTGAYVRGLGRLGAGGAALFAVHLLVVPTQSALLLVPASGSCLQVDHLGDAVVRLCPWSIEAAGRLGPADLSPWFWLLSVVPLVAAVLAGAAAARGGERSGAAGRGMAGGLVFAVLMVGGAWFAAPELLLPVAVFVTPAFGLQPDGVSFVLAAIGWGVGGGVVGGLSASRSRRRYDAESEPPRPTSA